MTEVHVEENNWEGDGKVEDDLEGKLKIMWCGGVLSVTLFLEDIKAKKKKKKKKSVIYNRTRLIHTQ